MTVVPVVSCYFLFDTEYFLLSYHWNCCRCILCCSQNHHHPCYLSFGWYSSLISLLAVRWCLFHYCRRQSLPSLSEERHVFAVVLPAILFFVATAAAIAAPVAAELVESLTVDATVVVVIIFHGHGHGHGHTLPIFGDHVDNYSRKRGRRSSTVL